MEANGPKLSELWPFEVRSMSGDLREDRMDSEKLANPIGAAVQLEVRSR